MVGNSEPMADEVDILTRGMDTTVDWVMLATKTPSPVTKALYDITLSGPISGEAG